MVESSTTIRLIEASLEREDVADRSNFRYFFPIPLITFLLNCAVHG